MRGAVREGRDWLASGRDRYRDWRETGGDPYRERRAQYEGTRYSRDSGWVRPGSYAGRGPRGYQRTDARIREDVSEILWRADEIDASDIDVTVENGEVTLDGSVDTRWTKRLAEDAAWEASGVYDVHNRLRIRRVDRDPIATGMRDTSGAIPMESGRNTTSPRFLVNMAVVGNNGDEVGIIKEVREDTLLVDRPMSRDIYIPVSAVKISDGSTARLNIDSGEVDNQGWQHPPIAGTDTDYDERVDLT
ncbi:MAG TPA: BON domain-containing protein [Thermomicrobiales bacterium]|nr:BON domain-containing protein [Thermomicrobiales bacterium]